MRTLKITQDNLHARIVDLVRSGRATSRSTLADALSVAPSTTGLYVDQLIAAGWVAESGLEHGKSGRPKVRLETVAGKGWFVGIEFNAARIHGVAVDFAGHTIAHVSHSLPPASNTQQVLQHLTGVIQALTKRTSTPLLHLGLGVPGLVDAKAGVARYSISFEGWQDLPLRDLIEERVSVPVILDNNLHTVALAERWFGEGRDETDYIILGPRSGFAISIVKQGKLLLGAHHAAGEIGLWPFPASGSGQCLHDVLSATAIWRRLAGAPNSVAPPADLYSALSDLSSTGGETWETITSEFARVIALIQCMVDADTYFLHGPLTALGQRFCDDVIAMAHQQVPALNRMPLKMLASSLGDDAGALGAAILAMESWSPAL